MCYNFYVQRNRRIVQNGGRFVDCCQISFNVPASLRRSLVTNLANPVSLNTKLAKGVTGLFFARKDEMSIPFTWVYLVFDEHTQLTKIGKSDNPDKRLHDLKKTPTILAAPTDSYRLVEAWLCPESFESWLHEQYKSRRVRGEWFHIGFNHHRNIAERFRSYQRWTASTSLDLEDVKRLNSLGEVRKKIIIHLEKQVSSLVEQRTHLVSQRDALKMESRNN